MGLFDTIGYFTGRVGPSGYGSCSTANEIALKNADSIKGKVAVVTGANSGIGKETTLALCKAGVHVVMACRSAEKARAVEEEIKKEVPDAQITLMDLDLQSLESVRKFASDFAQKGLPLHMLICNAGIMAHPWALTKDNISQPSRVVILSSRAHERAYKEGIRFDDPEGKQNFTAWGAYGQSKLANLMHAVELNKRFQEKGYKITANAVHPGVIPTNLADHFVSPTVKSVLMSPLSLILKTPQQGAATTVWAATDPSLEGVGGKYLADCNIYVPGRPEASDPSMLKRLFEYGLKLTGGCSEWDP